MLLEDDGLSVPWATGEIGNHNVADSTNPAYDASGMGYGNDRIQLNETVDEVENDNSNDNTIVHQMQCYDFREKLINHFDILFEQEQIKWPTRNGTITMQLN